MKDNLENKNFAIIKYVNTSISILNEYRKTLPKDDKYNELLQELKKYIRDYFFSRDLIIKKIKNLLKMIYIFN